MPLADQLFEPRETFKKARQEFKGVLPLLPLLQSGRPVEEVLAELVDESRRNPTVVSQLQDAQRYIRSVVIETQDAWAGISAGQSNLLTLVHELEKGRNRASDEAVAFVTFNYDTLIESALTSLSYGDFRGEDIDSLVAKGPYRLFKLHGSTNWGREEESGTIRGFAKCAPDTCAGRPMRPAIAIPVPGKTFECPQSHVDLLQALIPKTSRFIVIGWRAGEKAFLELLSELPAFCPGIVVAEDRQAAQATIAKLPLREPGKCEAFEKKGGFSQFIGGKERAVRGFLARTYLP